MVTAHLSWLPQYPHEREILFGPLTGIEVLGTRVDGGVVVIECAFSINLTALTLEQVVSKRRKVASDLCDSLLLELRGEIERDDDGSWVRLRNLMSQVDDALPDVALSASTVLEKKLARDVKDRPPEYFNDDAQLSAAIKMAVDAKRSIAGWPDQLPSLGGQGVPGPVQVRHQLEVFKTDVLEMRRHFLRSAPRAHHLTHAEAVSVMDELRIGLVALQEREARLGVVLDAIFSEEDAQEMTKALGVALPQVRRRGTP